MSIITNIDLRSKGRVAGIYEIRCSKDEGVYVGQSIDLWQRGLKHFSALRRGSDDGAKRTHHCKRLQQLYNEHGRECFSFNVVFVLDKDLVRRINNDNVVKIVLKPLEQIYMNKYGKDKLLNDAPAILSAAGAQFAEFELFHPEFGLIKSSGRCQRQFERDYNIPTGSISMLFAGLTKYTGNFFLSERDYHDYIRDRGLSVYHPIEGTLKIFRVVDFCKERKLEVAGIYGIIYKKDWLFYNGYFKNKEAYESIIESSLKWTSKYYGVERVSTNSWRFKIYKGGKVIHQESGNNELEVATRYQAKRAKLGLPKVPLLRMDKLLGGSSREAA